MAVNIAIYDTETENLRVRADMTQEEVNDRFAELVDLVLAQRQAYSQTADDVHEERDALLRHSEPMWTKVDRWFGTSG